MKTFLKTTGWLVMAAAIIFGTAACSSDDDAVKQPQNPAEPQVYTMTVTASKGKDSALARAMAEAGMTDGAPQTRLLTLGTDSETGKPTLNAAWADGEKVKVIAVDVTTLELTECGTLTATVNPGDATEATLSGTLTTAPAEGSLIMLVYPSFPWDYTGQKGTLADISAKYDYAYIYIRPDDWSMENNQISVGDDPLEFINTQAIVRFNLQDKDGNAISATSLMVREASNNIIQTCVPEISRTCGDLTINLDGASSEIWVALLCVGSSSGLTLIATTEDGDTYTYTTNSSFNGFAPQKFYTRTVKMEKSELHVVNDDTSAEVTKGEDGYILAKNGHYTVSGIGSGGIGGQSVTLTIEDGTVINGSLYIERYNSENIANIILNGDATVNGDISADYAYTDYTLISSASGNHTLTVNGTARQSCWRLAEGVTLRYSDYSDSDFGSYGYVKNADGSADITPTSETIGSVTYKVYEGSGTVSGPTVKVWLNSYIVGIDGSYVVFNNDDNHVTLTDTGATYQNDYGETNKCYTAPLTAGATTYTVYNSGGVALASNVPVSDGDILIYWSDGSSWVKKYW